MRIFKNFTDSQVENVPANLTKVKVDKLDAKHEYLFRVRAVNSEGESPNLEANKAVLAKDPFDEPGAPGTPEVVDFDTVK